MQQFEQEVHISDYVRIIKKRKGVLFTFFFVTVLIVTVGSFLMSPVYRATSTLLVDIESPNVLTSTGAVSLANTNYYAYKEYFQSQKSIIKSRSIVKQVFKEFDLGKGADYVGARDPINTFLKTIKIAPVRDTRLLLLHVDNKDPKLAADINNRIAEIYVARNLAYITKSEVLNLLKNEYLKLEAKLSEYSKVYKHKHPKMIRLKQEISQMANRIKNEKERVGDYDLKDMNLLEPEVAAITEYTLADLKANNITVQDRAEVPIVPEKPKKRLNILMALIVGLFGGIGLTFFFEYLDDTVKTVEDVERLVEWPFLGYIPRIDQGKKVLSKEKDLFTHNNPKDPVSEAYRTIRTSVLFSSTEEHPLKGMLVTSPGPQEGKTITLCNLGVAMAQGNKRVLLVDADMRKPRLHNIFGLENEIGLANFLSSQASFADVVRKTNIEGISLVCGGPHPPNPSELLASHKMEEFLNLSKTKFDFVLFDTPPMAVVTDAVVLSRVVDGTIVVLKSGTTNRNVLPRFGQVFKDAGSRITGTILNDITALGNNYQYYAYYYGKTT